MADIFISYCSQRRELTRELENRLVAEGYDSVWWDRELNPAAEFGPQIRAELNAAKAVIVIWTPEAVASPYVRAEARLAAGAHKLVSVRAPDASFGDIPEPFGEYHIAELGSLDDIVRGVALAWKGAPPPNALLAEHYFRNTARHVLSPKRDTLSQVASVSPALLLNARLALAPFLDVHGLRASMRQWAREGRPVRGQLIHGPGGLGKTRLMVEVAADLRKEDWEAGFVEIPDPASAHTHRQALEQLIDTDRHAGLMLVLDYAERRQDEAARYAELMLKAARDRPWRPLRLVLLARAAGEWWDRAVEETPSLTPLFASGVVQITPFPEVADRERLFTEACAGFKAAIAEARRFDAEAFAGWRLDQRPILDRLRQDLASDAFARPLMIQIAALLHLQGETPDAPSVASMLDAMLGVERRYWKAALGVTHTDARQTALCRGAIQTTLVGGAARTEAEALLLKDGYFARAAAADVAEPLSDLDRIYGDGDGRFLALEPDLVGEHLMAADGDARLIDACLDWAGKDTDRSRAILTVLQRATRGEHGAKASAAQAGLDHVIRNRGLDVAEQLIAVALETPGELAALIERAAAVLDPDIAADLEASIPEQTLRLRRAAGALAMRACAGDMSGDESGRSRRADRLDKLGSRLSDLGRHEEALTASAESVEIYRELAAHNRVAFLKDLAGSLNNLSIRLSELGRREEALTASAEALEIYRELAAQNRDAFLPNLAATLSNLSLQLLDLGRREEALIASAEAVGIKRELAAQNHDADLPSLALSLNNLGKMLSDLGRRKEALAASAETLEIHRVLAAQNRDAFLPNLAMSLLNRGLMLSNVGRRQEALAASAAGVEIYRELASHNRDAFLPNLAMSLLNLGKMLLDLGRGSEALTASAEALEIHRVLAAQNRDAVLPNLAMSLSNLGAMLSNLGLREEALMASAEALEIGRELAVQNRDAFLPDLAAALLNRGLMLSNIGRRDEALTTSAEAQEIYRELAAQNRDAFLPNLAMSLNNLCAMLSNVGRRQEALAASAAGVEIYRELASHNRDAFLPNLAMSLLNLGKMLLDLGRGSEALTASAEALEIHRVLAAQNHDAFLPNLAMSLLNRGKILSDLGRHEEALMASAEALEIYRELAAQNRDAFLPNLAATLSNLSLQLLDLGRQEEALVASAEAVEIYRALAAQNSDAFASGLASSLDTVGKILLDSGRGGDSVAAFNECLTLLKPYAAAEPGAFGLRFAQYLRDLVAAMRADGRGPTEIAETVERFGGDPSALAPPDGEK